MQVKYIHDTQDAEKHIAYCARVSSSNQENPKYEKLLKYCIKNAHWSVFEMASLCVEITTSRAIAQQILRHKSFSFQEFSQRYASALDREIVEARLQDSKNRQNSFKDDSGKHDTWFKGAQDKVWNEANTLYNEALERGIAKEQARFLLPLSTQTKMYMHGNLRSWITYIQLREKNGTQLEHAEIALAIKEIFKKQYPVISKALDWV